MRVTATFAVFLFLIFFGVSIANAVTVTINTYPTTITEDPFSISASISGATTGTNYLRVDIYKDQTTNYFGETYNGSDYYGGSTYTQYLPISIVGGQTWSGTIQARAGSPSSSQYDWTGTYKIRLRRYTSGGGNTASEANASAVVVSVNLPSPSPTPVPDSPSLSPSVSPSPTPSPTPVASKSPTPKPSVSPSVSPVALASDSAEEATGEMVLGVNTSSDEATIDNVDAPATASGTIEAGLFGVSPLFLGLTGIGTLFLSASGYMFFKGRNSGKIDPDVEVD